MLITFLNWIYITITAFVTGYFFLKRFSGILDRDNIPEYNWADYIVAGIVVTALYAGFFSIFAGVGIAANIIMILACVIFVVMDRKSYKSDMQISLFKGKEYNALVPIVLTVLFGLMYTAESTFHYDTGLYHAQAIHWIEDYGIVKGQGLVFPRMCFNSMFLPYCALYSMRDLLGGQSLHSASGYLVVFLCVYSIWGWTKSIGNHSFMRKTIITDLMRIAPFLYLLIVLLEITSPETDYISIVFTMWVIIRIAEYAEEGSDNLTALCVLAIECFANTSYKLSGAVMALVTIRPLVRMIKEKKWKNIAICGVIAIVMMLPYLIRTVIMCGWLAYPFEKIDLIDVPWKITKEEVAATAYETNACAKVVSGLDFSVITSPFSWVGYWWNKLYEAQRLFIKAVLYSMPVMVGIYIEAFVRFITKKYKEMSEKEWSRRITMLHLMGLMVLTLVFYFLTAPAVRYGYGAVLLLPLMIVGYLISVVLYKDDADEGAAAEKVQKNYVVKKIAKIIAATVVTIVILYPVVDCVPQLVKFDYEESVARYTPSKYLVNQVDYPMADVYEYEFNGVTFYLPKEGDQCWYYAFPSTPYMDTFGNLEMYSKDVKDGFKRRDR